MTTFLVLPPSGYSTWGTENCRRFQAESKTLYNLAIHDMINVCGPRCTWYSLRGQSFDFYERGWRITPKANFFHDFCNKQTFFCVWQKQYFFHYIRQLKTYNNLFPPKQLETNYFSGTNQKNFFSKIFHPPPPLKSNGWSLILRLCINTCTSFQQKSHAFNCYGICDAYLNINGKYLCTSKYSFFYNLYSWTSYF